MKIKAEFYKNGQHALTLEVEINDEAKTLIEKIEKWASTIEMIHDEIIYSIEEIDWEELNFELMKYYKNFKGEKTYEHEKKNA